jgi:hypothetical protein
MAPIMKKLSRTLPDKLSDLLELALADLAIVESQPERYKVDMSQWHGPGIDWITGRVICCVCLAGAVVSQSGVEDHVPFGPSSVEDQGDFAKLMALNYLRFGRVTEAYWFLSTGHTFRYEYPDEDTPKFEYLSRWMPSYSKGPDLWRAALEQLIVDLREAGL